MALRYSDSDFVFYNTRLGDLARPPYRVHSRVLGLNIPYLPEDNQQETKRRSPSFLAVSKGVSSMVPERYIAPVVG